MVFQNGEIMLVRKNNNALGQLYKATIVSSATRQQWQNDEMKVLMTHSSVYNKS